MLESYNWGTRGLAKNVLFLSDPLIQQSLKVIALHYIPCSLSCKDLHILLKVEVLKYTSRYDLDPDMVDMRSDIICISSSSPGLMQFLQLAWGMKKFN